MAIERPILDNHLHLDPIDGKGLEAVDEFADAGGTHLIVVNRPSYHVVGRPIDESAFRQTFEQTLDVVAEASDRLEGQAWAVLGVHPTLMTELLEETDRSLEDIERTMKTGLDIAATSLEDEAVLGLKSGRPHFECESRVMAAANRVLKHAIELVSETEGCLQLHTEAATELPDVAEWARSAGLSPSRVIKHYASGPMPEVTPSIIARKEPLERVVKDGGPFLMETDFIDDPTRPGAVLGPQTVPRRVRWMAEQGWDEAIERAHVEVPATVYGIDTRD